MSTAVTTATPISQASQPLSTVYAVGSVFAALGSIAYVTMNSQAPREAFINPINIVGCAVATVGLVLLSLGLMRWRTTLPGWAVITSSAGLGLTAANVWYFGTGINAVADKTDNAAFDEIIRNSSWIFIMTGPKMLLCLVGFLGLAIAGWRRRAIPRTAAVLLAIAAVLSLVPPHPPGVIVASLALFIVARAGVAART